MQKQVIKAQTKMRPALCLGCTPLKTALIALIKDLTVPSDFVYGYSDSLGEYTVLGVEGCGVVKLCENKKNLYGLEMLTTFYTVLYEGPLSVCDGAWNDY